MVDSLHTGDFTLTAMLSNMLGVPEQPHIRAKVLPLTRTPLHFYVMQMMWITRNSSYCILTLPNRMICVFKPFLRIFSLWVLMALNKLSVSCQNILCSRILLENHSFKEYA